jgi:hypothetical protein
MKAVLYTKYGSPDVLELKEVEKPTPHDKEALVKVHAANFCQGPLNSLLCGNNRRIISCLSSQSFDTDRGVEV